VTKIQVFSSPGHYRKKLRGQTRRFKAVEAWKKEEIVLSLHWLEKADYVSAKMPNGLWRGSRHSRSIAPPHHWQQWFVNAMLEIHDAWQQQLEALGKPYYLAVWVMLPDFQDSQVVASIGQRLHFYDNIFDRSRVLQKPLPNHLETGGLHWEHGLRVKDVFQEMDEVTTWDARTRQRLERATFATEALEDDTRILYFSDHVWIGREKT
jgi:hypothetical protein